MSTGIDLRKYRRMVRDDRARRELLWLRAQEKEDRGAIESLERADPGLRARMERMMRGTRPDLIEDRRERSAAFAELWHRCYDAL